MAGAGLHDLNQQPLHQVVHRIQHKTFLWKASPGIGAVRPQLVCCWQAPLELLRPCAPCLGQSWLRVRCLGSQGRPGAPRQVIPGGASVCLWRVAWQGVPPWMGQLDVQQACWDVVSVEDAEGLP